MCLSRYRCSLKVRDQYISVITFSFGSDFFWKGLWMRIAIEGGKRECLPHLWSKTMNCKWWGENTSISCLCMDHYLTFGKWMPESLGHQHKHKLTRIYFHRLIPLRISTFPTLRLAKRWNHRRILAPGHRRQPVTLSLWRLVHGNLCLSLIKGHFSIFYCFRFYPGWRAIVAGNRKACSSIQPSATVSHC